MQSKIDIPANLAGPEGVREFKVVESGIWDLEKPAGEKNRSAKSARFWANQRSSF